MSKKHKHKKRVGGWPRKRGSEPSGSGLLSPPDPRSRLRDPELHRAAALRGLDAVQRLQEEQESGGLSPEEFQRRMERFRDLLMTDPQLMRIRPEWKRVADAIREFPEAEEDAADKEEQHRRVIAYFSARILDRGLLETLQRELMDGLLRPRTTVDADAMALGTILVADALQDSPPSGNNPLAQVFANVMVAEANEIEQATQSIPLLETARENPAAAIEAMENSQALDAIAKKLASDPALRRHGERVAREAEQHLAAAVESGAIEAHLAAEEMRPAYEDLIEFAKGHDIRSEERMKDPALIREIVAIFDKFARDPGNRAAFERFTAEFDAQVSKARAAEAPNALQLFVLCQLWTEMWPKDDFIRILVVRASMHRIRQAVAAQRDAETEDEDMEDEEMEETTNDGMTE